MNRRFTGWEGRGLGVRWAYSLSKTSAECSTQTFSITVESPLIKESDMPDRDVTELATFKNLVERHWKAEVSLAG